MEAAVPTTPIDDPTDPRVGDFTRLTDTALRTSREGRDGDLAGRFIAEGDLTISRALTAGLTPVAVLASPDRVGALPSIPQGTPVYVGSPAVLEALTGYHVHRGLLASFLRPPMPDAKDVLATTRRVVVTVGLADPSNLGAIVRSAAALGVGGVLLDDRSCDPLYRLAVKVSAGTVFAVPWTRIGPLPAGLGPIGGAGFTIAALVPGAATDVAELAGVDRLALVVGNVRHGIPHDVAARADLEVGIPMHAGVDSLNAAAAVAVAVYASRPVAARATDRATQRPGVRSGQRTRPEEAR